MKIQKILYKNDLTQKKKKKKKIKKKKNLTKKKKKKKKKNLSILTDFVVIKLFFQIV